MTPNELNNMLIANVESVASYLLPSGRRSGNSWCAGSVHGESGQSLRVCLSGGRVGVWSDFSDDKKGGDLIELWQQSRGLSFVDTLAEIRDYLGVQEEKFTEFRRKKEPPQKPRCSKPASEVKKWLESRCLVEQSYSIYKVGEKGSNIIFPFISPEGNLELVKYRDLDSEKKTGKKKIYSNEDPEYHLFGWQAITENNTEVVICEGEIDAITWYQQGFPALSIPQGAGSGDKQEVWIQNDYERLLRFRTIYVSMDMDKAGQSCVDVIIERLGPDRCRVVDLGEYKDANEAHCDGQNLKQYIDNAKTKDPKELTQLVEHHDDIMAEFVDIKVSGVRLPWSKTYNQLRIRPSEITVWAGINSHGKSVALSHVSVDAVAQGEKVCIASMEMKPRKLGRKLYQQLLCVDQPTPNDGELAIKFLEDRIWLFEVYGTAKASRIIEVFNYARKRYGVTQFIVDSLAKCGYAEDDYNSQKKFVDRLMEFAGEFNVHVHLVVHIRKKEDENKVPGKMDIKGTGAITDMVDNVFIWWRNKPKEKNDPKKKFEYDAILSCEKQRETGEEPLFGFYFDQKTCQFYESGEDGPKRYIFPA